MFGFRPKFYIWVMGGWSGYWAKQHVGNEVKDRSAQTSLSSFRGCAERPVEYIMCKIHLEIWFARKFRNFAFPGYNLAENKCCWISWNRIWKFQVSDWVASTEMPSCDGRQYYWLLTNNSGGSQPDQPDHTSYNRQQHPDTVTSRFWSEKTNPDTWA